MILFSAKSISILFTVFCRKSLLFHFRKKFLRDMTDLTTTQTTFFLNVQSIRAYHDQLSVLIDFFDNKPALIGLTETWLSDNDPIGLYNLEGYDNIVCANRVNARGGNVAAFLKTGLNYRYFKLLVSLEHIVIKMCFVDHPPLNVCMIYRPLNLKLDLFLNLIKDFLLEMNALSGDILLMVELNINIIGSQRNFFDHKNLQLSFDLTIQNIEPTGETKISSKCNDLIIAAEETRITTINGTVIHH